MDDCFTFHSSSHGDALFFFMTVVITMSPRTQRNADLTVETASISIRSTLAVRLSSHCLLGMEYATPGGGRTLLNVVTMVETA